VILNLGWESHELCIETNDYILEAAARYPQRLIGFCAVQPLDSDKAVKELERCARAGARGVGELRPDVQGFDLRDDNVMRPLVKSMVDHDLILLIHASEPIGHHYTGKGAVTPDIIYPFILNYPELKLVCAHWGGGLPFYALMPEVYNAFKNVFFDTAATTFLYKPEIFRYVTEILGSDKILFGSDSPLLTPKRIIDQVESVNMDREDKNKILGDNAQRLLSIQR